MKIYYPVCQTYSPAGVLKSISKRWINMQEASGYEITDIYRIYLGLNEPPSKGYHVLWLSDASKYEI